jgi:hypothetical protein
MGRVWVRAGRVWVRARNVVRHRVKDLAAMLDNLK